MDSNETSSERSENEALHSQIDELLAAERTEAQKKPSDNKQTWLVVAAILGCLGLGFVGGLLAISTQKNGNLKSALSSGEDQQIVLSESNVIADVAAKVSNSVVSINVTAQATTNSFFFGTQSYEQASEGTGIILTKDGLVVTNRHVLPENATTVSVVLADGTTYEDVKVIGRDPFNDVAFLQIDGAKDLQPAELGNSADMRVGDKVIAIGNALGQFDTTVTSGIISGIGRPVTAASGAEAEQLTNLFQTDAAINPGNSGGPLLNINGQVIGINTAVAGNGENIGFSIPIDDIKAGITSVEKNGKLIRPYLGVRYVTLTPQVADQLKLDVEQGALIQAGQNQTAIIADSPADKAGLKEGDIITKVNDTVLNNKTNGLVTSVSRYQVGETITLTYLRDGKEQTTEVTLEAVPDSLTN